MFVQLCTATRVLAALRCLYMETDSDAWATTHTCRLWMSSEGARPDRPPPAPPAFKAVTSASRCASCALSAAISWLAASRRCRRDSTSAAAAAGAELVASPCGSAGADGDATTVAAVSSAPVEASLVSCSRGLFSAAAAPLLGALFLFFLAMAQRLHVCPAGSQEQDRTLKLCRWPTLQRCEGCSNGTCCGQPDAVIVKFLHPWR